MPDKTFVAYLGKEASGSSCGYCKSKDGFQAWGTWAFHMTVEDYQDLIDRGFRRSGHYVYKPVMNETCCPLYAIRNRVADFRMSAHHRRLLKQVARYLNTGHKPRTKAGESDGAIGGQEKQSGAGDVGDRRAENERVAVTVKAGGDARDVKNKENKAKFKRWHRKLERMRDQAKKQGTTFEHLLEGYHQRRNKRLEKNKEKTLEELFDLVRPDAKHKLTCKLVRTSPKSNEYVNTEELEHAVYQKYQVNIHGDAPDDCHKGQFERFLVESPLYEKEGALESGYGSFHYQYWLDDKLIGISVLDFLPHCISSVYFFYDTDYDFLSLGTYSALWEIALTRRLHLQDPQLTNYYLGYYVHSCRKMRYKGQYLGSDLLCPETFTWREIESCRPLLDRNKYSRLAADPQTKDECEGKSEHVLLLWQGSLMPWGVYNQLSGLMQQQPRRQGGRRAKEREQAKVEEYSRLVGETCAQRMILILDA